MYYRSARNGAVSESPEAPAVDDDQYNESRVLLLNASESRAVADRVSTATSPSSRVASHSVV
jgi:hypothetical protein